MAQTDFLQKALEGKDPRLSRLVTKVLNIYLTSPLSNRQDSSEERKIQMKRLIEEAARSMRTH